jgi:hypothetical protein
VKRAFILAALALSMVMNALPADAATTYLNEDFSGGVDNVFDSSAWGMEPLGSGHLGDGLRSIIPAGEHWGSSGDWFFQDHGYAEPDELYWRYYLKFPTGFYIQPPNRGKLPGPANLYTYNCLGNKPSTPENPCWSARMMFARDYKTDLGLYQDGPSDKTLIGFYTYNLDSPPTRGDIFDWNDDVALLDHGKWYCVEGHIKLNTPGAHDGVLEGWVDGAQAYSKDDLAWRRSTEGFLHVKSFWFDVYYGGDAASTTDEIHFDSLVLASEKVGCDDPLTWRGTFSDDDSSPFESDIEWLAASGVTKGCNPPANTLFCPADSVTRGQMAAFLARALGLPDAGGANPFTDDDGSVFEADIERLAAAGVTKGCTATKFCPEEAVTRGQMAAFLARAYDLPPAISDHFSDDDGSAFEADINRLADAGITTGCSAASFCMNEPVTRGQMAAFLRRASTI